MVVRQSGPLVRPGTDRLAQVEVDRIFSALADATRRDIVSRVLRTEASVTDLAERYDMSFAAVQKHVAVLERAHLVTKHRRGREQLVRGDVETVRAAGRLLDQLEEIWRGRVSRIDDLLAEPPTTAAPTSGPPSTRRTPTHPASSTEGDES